MDGSSGETVPKRHSRNGSSGRAPIIRRSTRGPVDVNETPIVNPLLSLNPSASQILSPTLTTPRLRSPQLRSPRIQSPGRSPGLGRHTPSSTPTTAFLPKDFSHLLRPEIYHPLSHLEIPTPFRSSPFQPAQTTPLPTLLSTGHFRPAAIAAASQLTAANPPISPSDHAKIFSLLYVRLSCLCLCGNTTLAAQEVLALEDLNSVYYRDDSTGHHLVPWELRILAVRLQGMGFNDARRGIMGYYDLGRDARSIISKLKLKSRAESVTEEEKGRLREEILMWEHRLADLGIRVASALIEMEDLEGAACFLKTLKPNDESGVRGMELAVKKALLWLCLGDIEAARMCVKGLADTGNGEEKVIEALALIADGEYEGAVRAWQELVDGPGEEEKVMWRGNLGVALLYCGRLDEARPILESLIEEGHVFHALTFNLSTLYELCTERSRALKMELVEKVAASVNEDGEGESVGWEKLNGDFKL